jgi:PPOX class probable F420-dependent enzyme
VSVPSNLAQFDGENYLSLETFRKNGQGVKTPVWFVRHSNVFYVYTEAGSGKVKRIRNNPRVRMAACNMRGDVKGAWVDATATLVDGDERRTADGLLDRKYFLKRISNLFSLLRRSQRAFIRIVPDDSAEHDQTGVRGAP